MNNMLPMLYETIFGFTALFLLTKVLGKTQISQLTAFDFIAALVLGELVGNALFDEKAGVLDIGYVIFLWGSLLFIVEIITQKFKGSRFLLEGKPSMIIYEGKFVYEEMRKNKVDVEEIQHLLRMKDIFSVQEVEYAILETNGDVSVLKKAAFQTPTISDLQVKQKKPEIAMTIITDGELIEDNLAEADLTREWVEKEVQKQYMDHIHEVFYAEYKDEKLYVLPYYKIKEKHFHKKIKKNAPAASS
ncbi:MAG TPA: DUF421 domain-containing protein [Bacillota bacterium]|nr:DUF421 domain-containing protein [Bacillota bacterium]